MRRRILSWAFGCAVRRKEEIATAAKYVRHLTALDRKTTPLKTLQGEIGKKVSRSGELRGDVYDDVPRAF